MSSAFTANDVAPAAGSRRSEDCLSSVRSSARSLRAAAILALSLDRPDLDILKSFEIKFSSQC
jgi:hypothetical protein